MSFKAQLNQEISKLEKNSGGNFDEVTHPTQTVKNDMLYFSKDSTEHLVRVLPPKSNTDNFAVGFRRMFFDVTNASNKRINSPMIMPLHEDVENYMLDQRVKQWVQNKSMPGQYPSTRPQTRYYLNVVRLNGLGGGQYQHELNADGTPMVRVLEVPQSAYKGIISDLVDTNITEPEGAGEFGAISPTNAYPIKIYRTGTGLDTTYHVKTYEHPLGPLPAGWENELEDLNYLATPSEEYNEEFVHYMIAVHEGREQEFNAERGQGGTNSGSTPQQNQGFGQPTQNQNFNQPTQNQQQNQGFGQPGPQDVVTDEDMSHLPPKEGFSPGVNTGQPNMPPTQPQQGGFNQPQQSPAQQPQQEGFSQPQQGQQTQNQPQQPNTGEGNIADVNDLLQQVKDEANKQ